MLCEVPFLPTYDERWILYSNMKLKCLPNWNGIWAYYYYHCHSMLSTKITEQIVKKSSYFSFKFWIKYWNMSFLTLLSVARFKLQTDYIIHLIPYSRFSKTTNSHILISYIYSCSYAMIYIKKPCASIFSPEESSYLHENLYVVIAQLFYVVYWNDCSSN